MAGDGEAVAAAPPGQRSASIEPLPNDEGAGEDVPIAKPKLRPLNGMMPRFPSTKLMTKEQRMQQKRSRSAGHVVGQADVAIGLGAACCNAGGVTAAVAAMRNRGREVEP